MPECVQASLRRIKSKCPAQLFDITQDISATESTKYTGWTPDFAPRRLHIRLHNRPTDWPKGAISVGSEWTVKWKDKEDGL